MIVVVHPEKDDQDQLLGGAQGRLLARMLSAIGLEVSDIYLASALPRHTPMADTQALAARGLDAVLAYHITLAAPQRVLALGTNILPLLGQKDADEVASLREINQGVSRIPLMVSEGLDSLMAMPRLKARFWRKWMQWSADT